ncbi:MAG: MFS transporter [Dehalococcoidia bacterium]
MALLQTAVHQVRHGFYGWRIVGLMLGPRAAGVGVYVFGNTLFVIPLEQDLGISRTVSSLLFALGALTSGLAAPISGVFMDRFGPRIVLIASVLLSVAGYALFAIADNVLLVFIVFLGPISLTILNVAFNASSGLANNWFERQKATAFSVLQIGAGAGSFLILPLLAFSIEQWGWRAAALVAGAIVLALGLPAAWLAKDTPEEMGLLPDGAPPQGASTGAGAAASAPMTGMSATEALRTPSFWLLSAGVMLFGGGTIGVQVHFVPIMVWKGTTEVQAGLMLTVVALSSIPLVLLAGWAADRFDRLAVGAGLCLIVAVGILLMNLAPVGPALWVAALLFAGSMGIWPIAWAVVGQMFGRRAYSTIRGYLMAVQNGRANSRDVRHTGYQRPAL